MNRIRHIYLYSIAFAIFRREAISRAFRIFSLTFSIHIFDHGPIFQKWGGPKCIAYLKWSPLDSIVLYSSGEESEKYALYPMEPSRVSILSYYNFRKKFHYKFREKIARHIRKRENLKCASYPIESSRFNKKQI